jgi:hypothetical protein
MKTQNEMFLSQLESLLTAMITEDESLRLLPLDKLAGDISAHTVLKLNPSDRAKYLKITEGTRRQYIDAYIHVKSSKSHQVIKRKIIPLLKTKRLFLDEYKMQSLDEVQLGWIFGKSSFAASVDGTKKWLDSLMGDELASRLDYQVRSQGIKYAQHGIETKTYAYVISSSTSTAQATYAAMTTILPIRSDYTVGFVGYRTQNFASAQDAEGVNQFYMQQKWVTTHLRQKQMHGFTDIDTTLKIQNETTTFRQFMLSATDAMGNCRLHSQGHPSDNVPRSKRGSSTTKGKRI